MLQRRSLPLLGAVVLLSACGDGGEPTPPELTDIVITPATATLDQVDGTQQFTAQALDQDGNVMSGVTFTWSSTDLDVATVDANGLATAVGDGTTTISAEAEGRSGTAELTVEIAGLQISSLALDNGRLDLTYEDSVQAKGGVGSYTFAVTAGSLPTGLALDADGTIQGTPTQVETSTFTVRVTDESNGTGTRQLSITVCPAATAFAVGESRALAAPGRGTCGVFLPSGDGDRYRVAVVRTNTDEDATDVATITLSLHAYGVQPSTAPAAAAAPEAPSGPRFSAPAALRRRLEVAAATRARHLELRRQEMALVQRIGTAGLLPDQRAAQGLRVAAAPLPEKLRIDPTTPAGCTPAGTKVTALKILEDDRLGIFQDSTQNATSSTRVTQAEAQALLDFYRDYGKQVIDEYFGGVPDVNGDGKVVIFITPAVSGNTAGFVWSGDFFSTQECPASNAMEIVFMSQGIVAHLDDPDTPAQGLETLVHEMKHVSSLYQRVLRSQAMESAQFHPGWWEEGVAELAGGVASRLSWADHGGPAANATLVEQDWRDAVPSGETLKDNAQFGVLLRLLRTQEYLASQPNALVVKPQGARPNHSVYGSGWVFSQWIGDGFGGAGTAPLADAHLWSEMNDQSWPSGIAGIQQETGLTWSQIMEQYALAIMLDGTTTPAPEHPFTSYDFPSAIELWCFAADHPPCDGQDGGPTGSFPWSVTVHVDGETVVPARSFASAIYDGPSGPGGIRVHEFVSNGTGVGTEVHADAPQLTRMVVVRIN